MVHNEGILWEECCLHYYSVTHPICVFLLLVDDIHIIGLASNMVPIFLRYKNFEH
jgi:hypothetical protein